MSDNIIQGFPLSPFVRAARVTALEKGAPHDFLPISFDDLKTEAFGRLNPFRKMPVLQAAEGFSLYETPAIMRYLDETGAGPALSPATPRERAEMAKWLSIASSYLYPTGVMELFVQRAMRPMMGGETDEALVAAATTALAQQLDVLEAELRGPGLFGDSPSLADILLGCMLELVGQTPEGRDLLSARPKVSAFMAWLRARPSFTATLPEMLAAA